MSGENLLIKAPTENDVLTKIEAIGDLAVRNAMLSLFWWRLAAQTAVRETKQETRGSSS